MTVEDFSLSVVRVREQVEHRRDVFSRSSCLSSIPYSAGLYSTDSYRQLNAHLCPTLLSVAAPVLALSLPVVKLVVSPERICRTNGQIVHTEVDPTQRAAPCVVVAYSACQTRFAPYSRYEVATRGTSGVALRGFVLVVERGGTMIVHNVRRSHTRLQHLLAALPTCIPLISFSGFVTGVLDHTRRL